MMTTLRNKYRIEAVNKVLRAVAGIAIAAILPFSTAFAATSHSILHSFTGADGSEPKARLVQASDGNFYGTTSSGGSANSGTIFKMTPSGSLTTLHSFTGGSGGANPTTGMIQASDGNFYGSIDSGGTSGYGYVYKVTPTGTFSTLFSFSGVDGAAPRGELTQGSDGNLYGVTAFGANGFAPGCAPTLGGSGCGFGTVFKLSLSGSLTSLYSFSSADDNGAVPEAGLIEGQDGNFYGTTGRLGTVATGVGTAFKITPAGALTTLHRFVGGAADGAGPRGALVQLADGTLYGTTMGGGVGFVGTIFKLAPDGTGFAIAHAFESTDLSPISNLQLLLASDGNIYGTTIASSTGGSGFLPPVGSIYQLTPAGGFSKTFIFELSLTAPTAPSGALPNSGLIQGADGNLYGTTHCGTDNCAGLGGTVYRLATGLPSTTPTVSISLDKPSIALGGSANLTWSSTNATACAASGAWTDPQSDTGTQTVTPTAAGTYTYTLTCNGSAGSASNAATLTVTTASGGGSSGGGGGGCTMNVNGKLDATLGLLVILALVWIARQRVLPKENR
jgi:uncharacterized repeat protein (TIGR03803 family)